MPPAMPPCRSASRAPGLRRRRATPLLLLACTALAACGSDAGDQPSSDPNGARLASSIALTAVLTLSGGLSGQASFTDDISPAATAGTCADAARGYDQNGRRYSLPRPPQPFSVGGRLITVVTHVHDFHGPGPYTATDLAGDDGGILLAVDAAYGYVTGQGASASLKVNVDGSGSFTFDKLTPAPKPTSAATDASPLVTPASSKPAPPTVSGTLTWQCVQVRGVAPSP